MPKFLLSFLLFIYFFSTNFPQYNPGARQISIANSDAGLANDVFSVFNNMSGLSQMNWREIGLYYSPAPFGFSEMANGFIAYHEPFSIGSLGIGGMTYGFELYRESRFTAAFSHNFDNSFFAGISLNYHSVSIKKYGSTGAVYVDVGGLYYLTYYIRWGFFVQNINHATFKDYNDQIPIILNTGISMDILNNLSLNASVEKDIRYNASISAGIEYDIIKYFSLRSGFSNEPSRYTAGIGIHYFFFDVDYAIFTHSDLGMTHQVGLIINFSSDKSRREKLREYLEIN
ncbi:MAG TPA: hypothetical protein VLB50_09105 [Ignavibacteriaceae bacterium]|nr:hypothetical protein [Ignavibacteriaceae bacterium]